MKHYKSAEFLSNFKMSSPLHQRKWKIFWRRFWTYQTKISGHRQRSIENVRLLLMANLAKYCLLQWRTVAPFGRVFTRLATSPKLWRFTSRGGSRLPQAIRTLEQIGSWS